MLPALQKSWIPLSLALVAAGCSGSGPTPASGGAPVDYGQPVPGDVPELFAPGVVSTDAIEINGVFTPDFRQLFFARQVDGTFVIFRRVRQADGWSDAHPLPLYAEGVRGMAVDIAVSPGGSHLYFLGNAPNEVSPEEPRSDIWVADRQGDGWSSARVVPSPVSTRWNESYPTVVADGSLYFSSNRPGGLGASDIYRAERLPDGSFAEPVNLGAPVNSEHNEGDTFVAPDESYLVLTSRRPGGFGGGDLYVAFRQANGGWSEPVNLGPSINTADVEFCPMVTPDGRYLSFSRRWGATWETTTAADVFWVDARVIERLR